MLTAEELRREISYDPQTGEFAWRRAAKGRRSRAGCISNGYVVISVFSKAYYAHRLAWLYMTGSWPADQIDHKNGLRADNRFENLREATAAQNNSNRISRGFTEHRPGKFRVTISVRDKTTFVGNFDSPELARAAYLSACANQRGSEWVPR